MTQPTPPLSHPAAVSYADAKVSPRAEASGTSFAAPAVFIRGLTHRYPKAERDAVHDLHLTIRPGEAFALLGPNGGGKTTTFRILATLLQPSSINRAAAVPVVQIFGHDALRNPAAARRHLGVVFQAPSLDIKLTARENLRCQAALYGLARRDAQPRIDALLSQFNLLDRQHDATETFSGGMRRRLEIAKALLHQPRLLLMDEPSTGLDPAVRRELWELLADLRKRTDITLAWTTHLMDEAEGADRLAIIAEGRLLTVQTPAQLKASLGGQVVSAEPKDAHDAEALCRDITGRFGPWAAGGEPVVSEDAVRFQHEDGPAVLPRLASLWPDRLSRLSVGQPTLEDAYLRLTTPR